LRSEQHSAPLSERFNLAKFTDDLVGDLKALRQGKITVREARARADLAKQVLRSVHYVVTAQKYLAENATPALPNGRTKQ
jgi:hypothetical protein